MVGGGAGTQKRIAGIHSPGCGKLHQGGSDLPASEEGKAHPPQALGGLLGMLPRTPPGLIYPTCTQKPCGPTPSSARSRQGPTAAALSMPCPHPGRPPPPKQAYAPSKLQHK